MSALRFAGRLPSDNDIPRYFAEWFFDTATTARRRSTRATGCSSDRPPLQVGYVLSQRPFGWDTQRSTTDARVVLQQLWIVGLWALLLAARVGGVTGRW